MTASLKQPWLTLIGIGEGGVADLPPPARLALDQAQLIVGGARHLNFVKAYRCKNSPGPARLPMRYPVYFSIAGNPSLFSPQGILFIMA